MTSVPPIIWHFPAAELPQDPLARFLKLFQVKEKWTFDEIEPYIRWVWSEVLVMVVTTKSSDYGLAGMWKVQLSL